MGQRPNALALIGLAAMLWLVVAGTLAAFLYSERKEALARATRSMEALTRLLDAHTTRTYEAVGITLAGVADALSMAPDLPSNDPVFRQTLLERLQTLQPYARAIFVVGPGGQLTQDTYYPVTPDVLVQDREYFQAHLNDPALERAIWPPLRSRFRMDWVLAVTRRIGNSPEFQGIVVASLEPRYFQALFDRLGLDDANAITLHHRDGTLIARHPHDEDQVGTSFAGSALFAKHLRRAAAGTYLTRSGVFSFERLVSYRALEGMPLVVAMSQDAESILKPWRDIAFAALLALGGLALLLAALIVQFLRQQRVRERRIQSEKLEALGYLTGGVSHDFANLLNVLSASLRILQAGPAEAARAREALAVAERAILRGSQLIDQLRAFARRQPLHVLPADLNLVITAGIELLRQVTGHNVKLHTELAAEVARCLIDETELEVALVNLLVNARDAGARRIVLKTYNCTEQAKPPEWRGGRAADYVCLAVIDDGRGMSADVRRRVFEPYFSTKGTQGTGLGLAQVYGFMRQVGGDVHIESQPGKGTTVLLIFPRAPQSATAIAQGQAAKA